MWRYFRKLPRPLPRKTRMTDTPELPPLPEPDGVIVVGTQAMRSFTAETVQRLMRAYAAEAKHDRRP